LFDIAAQTGLSLISPFREDLDIIRGGPEVRHFYWGRGSRQLATHFQNFIDECKDTYDYIILDTAPDLNVLSRNAIAVADMVLVPVDSSAMSIYSLEEIVSDCSHIKGPVWSIVRTMVNKRASRVQRLITDRLNGNESVLAGGCNAPGLREEEEEDYDLDSVEGFRAVLREYETEEGVPNDPMVPKTDVENPIYLLNSIIYRTENQNRLSFLGATSFDREDTKALAEQYRALAREVEEMLALTSEQLSDFQDSPMPELMCSQFG
jgi:cellulose biosynthesis protein BcsQ